MPNTLQFLASERGIGRSTRLGLDETLARIDSVAKPILSYVAHVVSDLQDICQNTDQLVYDHETRFTFGSMLCGKSKTIQ